MRKIARLIVWGRERWLEILMSLGFIGVLAWFGLLGYDLMPKPEPTPMPPAGQFDGPTAYQHVLAQVAFGARPTGSQANTQTGDYIIEQLTRHGWEVETQEFVYREVTARNIVGRAGAGEVVIVGAHYDTRLYADEDPDPELRIKPVVGANDGASGVAVLLELARALDKARLSNEVWLTFFDAEDNGRIDGWEFAAGSAFMAEKLTIAPKAVIVVDMVGDADQQLYRERNSTPELQDTIWGIAETLGYGDYFIPDYKWSMLDDHTAFLNRGIPALDIIDFDYPYWHTTQDTADRVAPESLERVGRVLKAFLEGPRDDSGR